MMESNVLGRIPYNGKLRFDEKKHWDLAVNKLRYAWETHDLTVDKIQCDETWKPYGNWNLMIKKNMVLTIQYIE